MLKWRHQKHVWSSHACLKDVFKNIVMIIRRPPNKEWSSKLNAKNYFIVKFGKYCKELSLMLCSSHRLAVATLPFYSLSCGVCLFFWLLQTEVLHFTKLEIANARIGACVRFRCVIKHHLTNAFYHHLMEAIRLHGFILQPIATTVQYSP